MQKFPMTKEGADKLREELNHLKSNVRREIVAAIAEARKHGDLKENAEYHAAKERQGFAEGRIMDIESKLSHAMIIDVTVVENTGRVVFGATVQMVNTDTEEEIQYRIVGEDEADIRRGMLSIISPLARALIGKEIGEVVDVNTPSGIIGYEILDVQHL